MGVLQTSEVATTATAPVVVEFPTATAVGSFYQPGTTIGGAYYQPSTVMYQTLPSGYQPATTSTTMYQSSLQSSSLLMNRTPFVFTADVKEEDVKDEEKVEEKKVVKKQKSKMLGC